MTEAAGRPPWSRVADLFHRALEQPRERRVSFVHSEAGDDLHLAEEVCSLLDAHDRPLAVLDVLPHPPPSPPPAPPHVPGDVIGPYRVVRILGRGGMGIVYLAEDERLERVVALKAVPGEAADDPARVARLAREARLAAALNHPGIATVYALEVIDGRMYVASEYVEGPTLREVLAGGPLPPARVRRMLRALAEAVGAAHARGIVHRDLKPDNIVVTNREAVKILDFGIARWMDVESAPDAVLTREHVLVGTPGYVAPERLRGHDVDTRSDVFALGVIGYELLTGRHPFEAGSAAATLARVLDHEPPHFADGPAAAPLAAPEARLLADLEHVIFSCLKKAPEQRLPSAAALVDALDAAGGGTSVPGPGPMLVHGRTPVPAPTGAASPTGARERARWWWRVHQNLAILVHVLLLLPLWGARDLARADRGMGVFLTGVLAVTVGGALRMHLLFTARERPHELPTGQATSLTIVRLADVVYAVTLLVAGVLAMRAEAPAVLLVAAAASVAIASLVIDRSTSRAAWLDDTAGDSLNRAGPAVPPASTTRRRAE